MPTLLALTLLVTLLLAAVAARAHPPFGQPGYIAPHLHAFRLHVNDQRRAKCMARFAFKWSRLELAAASGLVRKRARVTYKRRHFGVHAAASRCVPTSPAAIIRFVFPDHAE